MRIVILTLVLFLSQKQFAGCGNLILKTSNGILVVNDSSDGNVIVNTVSIMDEDSVVISVIRGSDCSARVIQVRLNGVIQDFTDIPKFYNTGGARVKILGKPGKYTVYTDYGAVGFEFIMKTTEPGCGLLYCKTSNGINVSFFSPVGDIDTAYISSTDSMMVQIIGPQCGVGSPEVKFNGIVQPLVYVPGYASWDRHVIKLPARPGDYKVSGTIKGYLEKVYFTLILNPVGIKELSNNQTFVKIYPNPARDFINILSEKEVLKKVSLKNSFGQEVKSFDLDSDHLEITLADLPAGIYFLQVATLSDKSNIRKILIE